MAIERSNKLGMKGFKVNLVLMSLDQSSFKYHLLFALILCSLFSLFFLWDCWLNTPYMIKELNP